MSYFIPKPPKDLFMYQDSPEVGILKENTQHYIIEKIETVPGKGIQVYYKDIKYPRKGFPTPESVSAVNIVKRLFIEFIKMMGSPQFFISLILLFIFRSKKRELKDGIPTGNYIKISSIEKLLTSFNRISYGVVSPYMLKPENMTPLASELQGVIYAFFARFGIENGISRQFALIFGTLIEYDNAYRYRLEDIFSETTKDKIVSDPYREIKRLMDIFIKREKMWMVGDKFKVLLKIISLSLLFPKVRSSIKSAFRTCNFDRLKLDEADIYWCSTRVDYDFQGKSYEERVKMWKDVDAVNIQI